MSQMKSQQAQYFSELAGKYTPNSDVCSRLQTEVDLLVTLSGPQAVGKTAVLANISPELHLLTAFTTRPQRPGESAGYRWRLDTPAEYQAILEDAEEGKLVQVQQGLGGFVYGNYVQDYAPRTIMDISASGALEMNRLPFKGIVHLFMVSPPEQYIPRFFAERLPQVGLLRTIESLDYTIKVLAQTVNDDRFVFVNNVDGQLAATIDTVKDIANGEIDTAKEAEARHVGALLLSDLEEQAMNDFDL